MAKAKRPGRRRHNWRTVRRRLTALFVSFGVLSQIAWFGAVDTSESCAEEDPYSAYSQPCSATPLLVVACIGSALLLCAVLLYVPEGIRRARQAYRERQMFKDRFR